MRLPKTGPRAVKTRPEFLTNILIAEAILAGILLLALAGFSKPPASDREVVTRGKSVPGVVLNKTSGENRNRTKPYYELAYRYTVDGRTYQGASEVTLQRYITNQRDSRVTVRYLSEKPERSILDGAIEQSSPGQPTRYLLLGLSTLLAVVTLGYRAVERRQRRVLREWAAIPVTIRDVRDLSIGDHVQYELLLADENAQEWRVTSSHRTLSAVGTTTVLLQNPENHGEIRLMNDLPFVEPNKLGQG